MRYVEEPSRLWSSFSEYVLDDTELVWAQGDQKSGMTTLGEYVEGLLAKDKYCGTLLPRIPVAVRRQLEERLAPLPQFRKRMQANRRNAALFRNRADVEIFNDGRWTRASILEMSPGKSSRPRLRVRTES